VDALVKAIKGYKGCMKERKVVANAIEKIRAGSTKIR
jgi:hypothetical protein